MAVEILNNSAPPNNKLGGTMFTPGQSVTWVWKPRGGYGYEIPCRAEVVRVTGQRVQIRVWRINRVTRDETPELKFVRPESLRLKAA